MHPALIVGLGGAAGSMARWAMTEFLPSGSDTELPWPTVIVNLSGAFLLGAVFALSLQEDFVLLLGTGVLGGFTTMSAFGLETARLLDAGNNTTAAIYVGLNLLAPLSAWLGWNLSEAILA